MIQQGQNVNQGETHNELVNKYGYDENEGYHYYDSVTGEKGYLDPEDIRDPVIVYPN